MAAGRFSVYSIMSFPAIRAFASIIAGGPATLTPCIFIASVITRPLKPSSSLSKSVITGFDKLEGIPVESRAGTFRCAVITPVTPALMAILNGYSSTLSILSRLLSIVGKALCESILVSP